MEEIEVDQGRHLTVDHELPKVPPNRGAGHIVVYLADVLSKPLGGLAVEPDISVGMVILVDIDRTESEVLWEDVGNYHFSDF